MAGQASQAEQAEHGVAGVARRADARRSVMEASISLRAAGISPPCPCPSTKTPPPPPRLPDGDGQQSWTSTNGFGAAKGQMNRVGFVRGDTLDRGRPLRQFDGKAITSFPTFEFKPYRPNFL